MATENEHSLTPKQQAFVWEYLTDFNAAGAARRAGYKEKTARQSGKENLTKPYIQAAIQSAMAERAMAADEVLLRLGQQARADHSKCLKVENGKPYVDFEALINAGLGHLIKKLKPTDHGVEVEFHDAQRALELIGKHHKLFTEKHEHTGAGGGPIKHEDVGTYSGLERRELNQRIAAALANADSGE